MYCLQCLPCCVPVFLCCVFVFTLFQYLLSLFITPLTVAYNASLGLSPLIVQVFMCSYEHALVCCPSTNRRLFFNMSAIYHIFSSVGVLQLVGATMCVLSAMLTQLRSCFSVLHLHVCVGICLSICLSIYVTALLQTDLFLDYLFRQKTKAVPVR